MAPKPLATIAAILRKAMQLATAHFPNGTLSFELATEHKNKWIELEIKTKITPDDAIKYYNAMIAEWATTTTPEEDAIIRFILNLT